MLHVVWYGVCLPVCAFFTVKALLKTGGVYLIKSGKDIHFMQCRKCEAKAFSFLVYLLLSSSNFLTHSVVFFLKSTAKILHFQQPCGKFQKGKNGRSEVLV